MRAAWILIAVLGVWSVSSSAQAQPAVEARGAFERGMEALASGRFRDATVAFEQSFVLAPRVPTAFNWALALRGLGQALEAERLYLRLAAGEFGPLRPADHESVQALLVEVQATISELRLTIDGPPELEARLDSVIVARAPGEHLLRLDPGEHGIVVSAHDHQSEERRVSADGSALELTIATSPFVDERPGTLVLSSGAEDASFAIIGPLGLEPQAEGPSPWRGQLAPGRYTIVVRGPHGENRTEVEVPAGRSLAIALDPPGYSIIEEPWFWVVIGVGVAALVGGAVGVSRIEREVPPLENEVFPTVFALTASF